MSVCTTVVENGAGVRLTGADARRGELTLEAASVLVAVEGVVGADERVASISPGA